MAAATSTATATAPAIQLSKSVSHFIEAGDLVLVYLSHNRNPLPVIVQPGAVHVNSFGAFPHSTAFLDKPFGSRVNSSNGRGFVYVLRPTPELWTLSLPHRTQILYQADIAFITQQLRLTPGSRIIEAGTGSGSFTHSLARTVGRAHQTNRFQGTGSESVGRNDPREQQAAARTRALSTVDDTKDDVRTDGKVFSFEFHAQRYAKAKIEFAAHGLSEVVRMTHRNVCRDGFLLSHPLPSKPPSNGGGGAAKQAAYPIVDAVFLDLPAPWEAVPLVAQHLDRSHTTRICCFSPCIEQVLKTVAALNAQGFADVQTWEVLMREIESTPLAKRAEQQQTPRGNEDEDASEGEGNGEVNGMDGSDDNDDDKPKSKRKGNNKLGKRKRDDTTTTAAAAAPKTRWGLERPRDVTTVIERILDVEERKEIRRAYQVEKAKVERERRVAAAAAGEENEGGGSAPAQNGEGRKEGEGEEAELEEDDDDDDVQMNQLPAANEEEEEGEGGEAPTPRAVPAIKPAAPMPRLYEEAEVYGRVVAEMRGHTSYLTFGTMLARVPGADVVSAREAVSSAQVAEKTVENGHKAEPTPAPTIAGQ
ncbi:unnamed protein product [Tilletia laevis]|uniref:tRNA (adenine(58)-N(1))-methyltransferase catalytic subunit TRM61 n=2 Tax=Tilletia TaxID=13289 RepID=A0A9N8M2I6_9BASI|nr:hypothetical protein CF336_g5265 [Tilletia laevis]CAD6889652.1 unnamed protein product [Tilletia caries]KAE8197993.1 hypothetical protein CF335_g4485 [Tilletia laevis]CAD6948872.1 unnamed protein product [Tilletia laevis]CAD6953530.1 unnamed protein product [Tilletia caries]